MSGHSKWATTKRQKSVVDAKRSIVFSQLAKLISIAAKTGGDPEANFSLRMAVDRAKAANMPKDNIDRAIKRGTGESKEGQIEELVYEGFGPAQSQFIVKCLTDNRNRTASQIRHLFSKNGGSLGAVMWNFEQKGVIRILAEELELNNLNKEEFELELIDSGADDILSSEEGLVIYTKIDSLQKVNKFLESKKIKTESASIEYVAKEELEINSEEQEKIDKFIEELEDNEDVADFYSNLK